MKICYSLIVCLIAFNFVGCTVPNKLLSPKQRLKATEQLARSHNWHLIQLPVGSFTLVAFIPDDRITTDVLTIYIEGDGFAWRTPTQPSNNPTPVNPIGFKLALHHPQGAVAYLSRPCQYTEDDSRCSPFYWTTGRYGAAVISATNQAVDILKQRFEAVSIELIGYSGGAAIATLVAAKRKDIKRLISVAGNLDHQTWTTIHKVSPLDGSLNPVNYWKKVNSIPQIHFVGESDSIVPLRVAASYQARFPNESKPEIRIIKNFDHACCWAKEWGDLYPHP